MADKISKAIKIGFAEDFHGETELILRELKDAEMSFEHQIVSSESELLEMLSSFQPDVVLSPYSLRETNAVKLLTLARNAGADTPFILLAFDLSEDIAIDLLAEGIEDYVLRSTIKRLPVAIRKALQRHKTQLELKISEAQLRKSEASLNEAQKIAKIGSWEWEISKEEVLFSDEMYRIYDTEPRPFTLEMVKSFVHPDDRDWIGKYLVKGLTEGYEEVVDYRIVSGLGVTKFVRSHTEVIRDSKGDIVKLFGTLQDITERKRIENELLNSRGLLSIGEQVASSGSFELNLKTRKTRWSDNLYRITGFDPGTEITFESFIKHVHPDDQVIYKQTLRESLSSNHGHPFVYRFIRPDNGEVIYLQANGRPLENNGKVTSWIGSIQDITDRILTQLELERSQASLIEAQKIARVGNWEWDAGTEEVWWSDEMYNIYEIEKRPITLSDVKSFIHPEDQKRVEELTKHDLDDKIVPVIEYRIYLPSVEPNMLFQALSRFTILKEK